MQKRIFEVHGPAELDVRLTSGLVEIETSDDGTRVELELVAHDEESQALVDNARVEFQDHHGRPQLLVDVPQRKGGGFSFGFIFGRQGITCRIRAPHGSPLSVRTKSADIDARGLLGSLSVATASGDVRADRVEGSVNVKSASADVEIREVQGSLNVQTASGDVSVDVVRGSVNVTTASGDVRVDDAHDSVNANTVSGDQLLGAVVRGKISAHSVSGDVHIGVRRGSKVFLDCNTVSGDTTSELELTPEAPSGDGPLVEIRAKTVSGDIQISRASAPATDIHASDNSQEVHA
jgi:putative adhesin